MDKIYDLIIIGSGPAGYVGAIRARQLGLTVCVVEKASTGGVCLNKGCIPTKTQIAIAQKFSHAKDMQDFGVTINADAFRYELVQQQSAATSEQLSKGVDYLFKKNNIDLFQGTASLYDAQTVSLDNGQKIKGKHILLATGSRPRELPIAPFDGKIILSSDDILNMASLPESMLIIGGGAIGCEWAYILSTFGVNVQLLEMMPNILPAEDIEMAKTLERSLKKQRIKIHTEICVKKVDTATTVRIFAEDKKGKQKEFTADKLLVVTGRIPNSENIGIEELGICTEQGFVCVGDYYETNVQGVFAVGDLIKTPLLAHLASKEAETAVEYIAGHKPIKQIDPLSVPRAVYTEPQIAGFGHTQESAEAANLDFFTTSFHFRGCGKAVAIDEKDGLVKLILSKDKKILGASLVGSDATELLHELLLARQADISVQLIANTIHAHPTLSEAIMEAAKEAFDGAIHS